MSTVKPSPPPDMDVVAALRVQRDDAERRLGEALSLLREAPTRQRLVSDFYWPLEAKGRGVP